MITHKINSYYFLHKIKEHKKYKKKLIDLINKTEYKELYESTGQAISKTDWDVDCNIKREYVDLLYKMLTPYLLETAKFFEADNVRINRTWFQQYIKNDYHNWHTHPQSNYSSVYYLQLKDPNIKTEIMDYKTKKILKTCDIEEGDFIIFPAYLLHRSPKNKTNSKKTIFSLNLDFLKKDENI
tara:strand:- start:276 stop:824 length:549 start_codon:yes stop_codon:yes gene_type:complete